MIDEDKTYENEVKPTSDDRGSLDLTLVIENLNKKIKNLSGLEKIHRETKVATNDEIYLENER